LAALAALALAVGAQVLLENVRLVRGTAPLALPLFAVAAGLAVFATWRVHEGEASLRIEVPARSWILACLPGMGLILTAGLIRVWWPFGMHAQEVFFWSLGVVALLAVGVAHSITRRRQQQTNGSEAEWPASKLVLAYVCIAVVALFMRTVYRFTEYPGWVEADEAYYAFASRAMLEHDPFDWFSLYMIGMPTMQLVPFMTTQGIFGGDLWGARVAGVIMGVSTALFTFAFARRLAGNVVGLTAALLVASAHTLVHFSRTAQIYTQTPLSAAIIMFFFARAWTGGSLLSWVGSGIALGIGTQTYQASHIMPLVVGLNAVGWARIAGVTWRRAAALTVFVEIIAFLLLMPVLLQVYRQTDLTTARPKAIYAFTEHNRPLLGDNPWLTMAKHVRDCLAIFNTGEDHVANYGAARSMVDAATAAVIPLTAALVVVGLRTPIGWVCAVWVGIFFFFGVMLIVPPPTFHRLPAAIVFSCFAAAWAVSRLLRAVQRGFNWRPAFVTVGCLGFAAVVLAANFHFYLYEMRLRRGMLHTMALTRIICGYAATHTVIDATTLDGREFVPKFNSFLGYECPKVKRIEQEDGDGFWNVDKVTSDEHVVLVVPKEAVDVHPGTPTGYRVVREYIDQTSTYPLPLPLAVYELERAGAQLSNSAVP
jgi:hypothetical protein